MFGSTPTTIRLNADSGTVLENTCENFFYALTDRQYNVVGMVSHGGHLVETCTYDPYGRRIFCDAADLISTITAHFEPGDRVVYN